jgi:hypothetical protein
MPSIFKQACWADNFVPPPIVPTSSEYIVQEMYRSRFSGPVVSSHVKPKRNHWISFFFVFANLIFNTYSYYSRLLVPDLDHRQ